jgi:hypothetical protein
MLSGHLDRQLLLNNNTTVHEIDDSLVTLNTAASAKNSADINIQKSLPFDRALNNNAISTPHVNDQVHSSFESQETHFKTPHKVPWPEAVTQHHCLKSNSNAKTLDVNKRRPCDASRSKTVIGKKVNNGEISWRGADLTIDRYVGLVGVNDDNNEVRKFIEQGGVTVVEFLENPKIEN